MFVRQFIVLYHEGQGNYRVHLSISTNNSPEDNENALAKCRAFVSKQSMQYRYSIVETVEV